MIDFNHRPKFGDISDQMNAVINEAILREASTEAPRNYLGASSLGGSCTRQIQYEYQNTPTDKPKFKPETHDIFRVGHFWEELTITRLRSAGFEILTRARTGRQIGYEQLGGKIKGHVDGIMISSPFALRLPAIFEHKALGQKSWKKLENGDVAKHFPKYTAQVAQYQIYLDPFFPGVAFNPAVFMITNRDTAERKTLLLPPDPALAQAVSDKGVSIIRAAEHRELMPRVAASPDWWECKICAWEKTCWEAKT